jgi:hypothetical protein
MWANSWILSLKIKSIGSQRIGSGGKNEVNVLFYCIFISFQALLWYSLASFLNWKIDMDANITEAIMINTIIERKILIVAKALLFWSFKHFKIDFFL